MSLKGLNTLTDPSDFLPSKLPKLSELDSLLRCHICKEFLIAPMLTSCGHSFCSMCIRKYLMHTPKCPICAKELRESHLSRNVLMEQVVLSYKDVRSGLLDVTMEKKDDSTEVEFVSDDDVQIIGERKRKGQGIDALFKRKKEARVEMGECPVCQRLYPLMELETSHIDLCLSGERSSSVTPHFQPKETSTSYTKLSKLDFPSLSTSMLKSKLLKLDLPVNGTRQQLESRYNEYLILWNANCDSVSPKDARVLKKQLAQWESSLGFKVKNGKQLDKQGWKELIEQARSSLKGKADVQEQERFFED